MKRFENKTVIVTGGNSGIGRATALRFAQEGAQVAIIARTAMTGNEVVTEIRSKGGEAAFFQADISNACQVQDVFKQILDRYDSFQAAFNCSGFSGAAKPFDKVGDAEFDEVIKTNLYGLFHCMKHEIVHFLRQSCGSIVNCSSVAGLIGVPELAAYNASKHAVIGFTKSVALDYAKLGIRVNAICPGGVMTTMMAEHAKNVPDYIAQMNAVHPLGRVGRPEEIAGIVLWLCSEDASFVTGQAYAIDGGYTVR
jgi:NAD(P)-dependent dehydrogenase (short-subunit alcohol dehydrogenase family)